MFTVRAAITLKGPEQGGSLGPAKSGMKHSFDFNNQLAACEVISDEGLEVFPTDQSTRVIIRLPYADQLGWKLQDGSEFTLSAGAQAVALGKVIP